MQKFRLLILASLFSLSAFSQIEDDVVINEFVVNPTSGKEYVELLVVSDNVNLQGWTLSDVATQGGSTSATEGDFTLPSAPYLASVRKGTYIVLELSVPAINSSTLTEDLDPSDKKLILKSTTSGVSTAGTVDVGNSENFNLYAGARASGALIDQLLSGSNTSYINGTTWGDNSALTSVDNINAGVMVTSGSAVLFVPAPQLSGNDFKNNDTGTKYVVQAASYGTPGAANTGVNDSPLPVTFLSFRAERSDNSVLLSWSTASELNNDHFSIERSEDGLNFLPIGIIQGAGQSSMINSYVFRDANPADRNSYYRLKQVDFNGEFTFSSVILVHHSIKALAIGYAALGNNNLTVAIHALEQQDAILRVFDVRGNLIAKETASLEKGNTMLDLQNITISKGIYVIQVEGQKGSFQQKFLF